MRWPRIRPARPETKLERLIARLVHDSAREPLPAGLRCRRSACRDARCLRPATIRWTCSWNASPRRTSSRWSGRSSGGCSLEPGRRPCLADGAGKPRGKTTCNTFGEFQLEYEPRRNLRLLVPLQEAGKRLEIALDHLSPGKKLPSGARVRNTGESRAAPSLTVIRPSSPTAELSSAVRNTRLTPTFVRNKLVNFLVSSSTRLSDLPSAPSVCPDLVIPLPGENVCVDAHSSSSATPAARLAVAALLIVATTAGPGGERIVHARAEQQTIGSPN